MSLKLIKVRQKYQCDRISDIGSSLLGELEKSRVSFNKGSRIAIAVGSRGIANIDAIVKLLADYLLDLGAKPFIVPSMGSHGGAQALGQLEVLESLGISEKTMGIPIISSMEVFELPSGDHTNRIFMDKNAWESDGVVLVNRIKPHTDYHGPFESGLAKMCVVGLGKHQQALEIHKFGVDALREFIPTTCQKIIDTGKILMGIGIIENPLDDTLMIRCLSDDKIMEEEPKLLQIARENMPSLLAGDIDILIVDKLGKNISGTGLDPNIIGKIKILGVEEPKNPRIKYIVLDDLTNESHGNALGMGFADIITKKLYDKTDFDATYENVRTSTFYERAKVPIVAKNCKRAFEFISRAISYIPDEEQRIMRIKDTLHIGEMLVSQKILEEIRDRVEVIGEFEDAFGENGELNNLLEEG